MTKTGEREIAKKENVNGGAGYVLMEALLNEEERALPNLFTGNDSSRV